MVVIWVKHHCVTGNVAWFEKYKADDSDYRKEQNFIITTEPKNAHSWCVVMLL
jgi:hypothetical protein